MHWERNHSKTEKARQPKTDLFEIRVFMEQHFNEQLSVEQLAAMANISPKYFVDLFTKTYGQSAMDFLTDLRINRAKRYLIETEYRLREIAQRVGYSDEFYFSRKFKKEVGVSPSAFVKHPRKRIAACSPSIIGQLLALNIIPVAAPLDSKWTPYYYNVYQTKIKVHMSYGDAQSLEESDKLIKSRPDAIVGFGYLQEEEKQRLSSIAPSLFVEVSGTGWREQLYQIAVFVEREKQATAWIEGYEQKLELARKQMQQTIGEDTFVVLRVYGQGLHLYCNHAIQGVLYRDLKLSSAYAEESLYNQLITLEQLNELDADRFILLVCPEAESRAYWLSLQHDKSWRFLKAVQKGNVYVVPSDPWCESSAVAANRMLDEMLLLLTGHCPNMDMDKMHGDSEAHPL
ncbi:AraC family transcriptional regulator [Paenibacillus sp. FSL H8-0548]|uniref:helix-turn-helix domain-containing protein n=1 Tax=Paenibacillus sp. FSL H8-0548 TaxID=1920422 RepID=UPI00096FFF8C|nr:AraC family transcriptional regulator [Paenibacillus sp. FSL H8-0548]OMF37269.1 AraC family transcriptional regulator [Paenibacillus sp. FSL H8-0548]